MSRDICTSYSFSFQLKTCQDVKYYRKTTVNNPLKINVEHFILNFIKNHNNYTKELSATKGRPVTNKVIAVNDKYTSFQFSLKKSTITKIRKYKKLTGVPDLDKHVEKYIKQLVPSRIVEV